MSRSLLLGLTLVAACRFNFDDVPAEAIGDAGATDASSGDTSDAERNEQPNRIFTMRATSTGAMTHGPLVGRAAADATCSDTAAAANLTGTFVALLSTSSEDGAARLEGSSGWVRTDGVLYASSVADFTTQNTYATLSVDEVGVRLPINASAWMGGSRAWQRQGSDTCADFTSDSSALSGTLVDVNNIGMAGTLSSGCQIPRHLVCAEIGRNAMLELATTGRYAFGVEAWNPGTLATADLACTTKAAQLSLPGTYVAALATSTQSIAERAGGLDGPWRMPDNVPITSGRFEGTLRAPVGRAGGRQYIVWLGAASLTARQLDASWSCADWSDSAGTGAYGDLGDDRENMYLNVGGPFRPTCSSVPFGLLCLQQD